MHNLDAIRCPYMYNAVPLKLLWIWSVYPSILRVTICLLHIVQWFHCIPRQRYDIPVGFMYSISVSLESSRASSSILSIPLSFSAFCIPISNCSRGVGGDERTFRQVLYCLKRGSHSSVWAFPRRNSGVFLSVLIPCCAWRSACYFQNTISGNRYHSV
jgi:hypothetical protein